MHMPIASWLHLVPAYSYTRHDVQHPALYRSIQYPIVADWSDYEGTKGMLIDETSRKHERAYQDLVYAQSLTDYLATKILAIEKYREWVANEDAQPGRTQCDLLSSFDVDHRNLLRNLHEVLHYHLDVALGSYFTCLRLCNFARKLMKLPDEHPHEGLLGTMHNKFRVALQCRHN